MNNVKYGYLIFGAIFGATVAMLTRGEKPDYVTQSGEGATCARGIRKRDEATFREEVASANT